jgi:anti-sigma regulatory factor (Ser/Thr protein kinase)
MSFVWRHCANASEIVSDVALATTEACDNVVRHAYPRAVGVLHLVARIDRRVLLVVVADAGVGLGDAAATDRPPIPGATAYGGRAGGSPAT